MVGHIAKHAYIVVCGSRVSYKTTWEICIVHNLREEGNYRKSYHLR